MCHSIERICLNGEQENIQRDDVIQELSRKLTNEVINMLALRALSTNNELFLQDTLAASYQLFCCASKYLHSY